MTNGRKFIKVLGLAATIIGVGANLITEWVNEQKMDEMIEEKVNKALALENKDNKEES
jgi:hypothetical protein